ncbi:MAG: hypothetical protein ACRDM1_14480 [Gaiellaceae bacterium]
MKTRVPALLGLLAIAVWLGLAVGLAAITSKVADWFVMTDELLYERLALSIAHTHSPLPRVHTQVISNINQLYPLIIAPVYRHGAILHGFHEAHVLNAFVMSSAALPAYLLARRVSGSRWLPFVVAIATVTVPWITLSSFLLTEVAAYPAFVWALLGVQAAVARPSARNDLLAVAGLVLAVLARTQFYAFVVILPVALLARAAVERRLKETIRRHAALVAVYAVGAAAAIVLLATGHHLLGTYAQTAGGNPLPLSIFGSAPAHLAVVALGGGLLPFLLGGAWLVSNLRRSETAERAAFAWVGAATVVVLTFEVASFDLRFGGGLVRERYLFYLTPLLLVAFAAALTARRAPRWSLVVPVAIAGIGFWQAPLPVFQKLNADTPVSVLDDWLRSTMHGGGGARGFLILAVVVLALVYVEASVLVHRLPLALCLSIVLLIALPAETGYAFKRLFAVDGTSGLPLTLDQSIVFGWVDREITTGSEAVMVPYPVLRSDYWASVGFWWDFEFWNKSVDREAAPGGAFSGTPPGSFPKLDLRFDPHTGRANVDLDSYIAQSIADARFHVAGRFLATQRGVSIVFPDRPWRADWVSYGLYDDGWTRPGTTARIRAFAAPGQKTPLERTLTFELAAPGDVASRPVVLRSNDGVWRANVTPATMQQAVSLCVPRRGYTDVSLRASGSSSIYGDPTTVQSAAVARPAGVLVGEVTLAPEPGTPCKP